MQLAGERKQQRATRHERGTLLGFRDLGLLNYEIGSLKDGRLGLLVYEISSPKHVHIFCDFVARGGGVRATGGN